MNMFTGTKQISEQTSYIQSPIYAKDAALNTDLGFTTLGGLGNHLSYPMYVSSDSAVSHIIIKI